ncbi:branched-chain amino acid ABC transporter permease [Fimbriimonas ginsengisoli]|uniref:Putative transport system permease protein n=1 Tax=Fimbriimonas ginsengisoli Gsoil 348 TaxID=661478 RepID=A0A068NWB6_FIMGI|nr:branched-chain amino acid ABC transporter permease [Fimbriimonas ginsengisoli]AIE87647.1 putative transport system permease protein [Fimbriimonas ginsengisoli Gsoil 348]
MSRYWIIRIVSIVLAVLGCFLLEKVARGQNDYTQRLIVLAGLYVTLSVSLNLINGITGQFSIGHAAFYQVGAYLGAFLTGRYFAAAHLPPLVWLVLVMFGGALAAAVAGLVVGLPSLRLRGDYLAIVTLGFGEIIRIQVQNTEALGGSYGMNVAPKIQSVAMVWLLAIFCIAVCRNLLKTAHGLPFLAVREDEVASSAMGVNITKVKVTAFVLGSAFAGAAGALLAHYEGFITPTTFSMDVSFIILTMVVLGGTGSITGSIVSALFLSYLPEYLRSLHGRGGAGPLTVSGSTVVAALIGVVVAVALIKRIVDDGRGTKWARLGFYAGSIVIGVVVQVIMGIVLSRVKPMQNKQIEADQLRMVIFAVTLIVLMLLRPQGVFAHHEFSWTWVKKLFGGKGPSTEVAA